MPHVTASPHADHDRLLVATYAAGDATGAELETAQALVATCADCATLHRDLRAIAGAVAALPAPVRSRDFRLTPEQAARLRPSPWRRLLAPFAGPRFAFAGPLGTGLATLGIAGLLVAGSLGTPLTASAPTAGGRSGPEAAGATVEGTGAAAASGGPAFAVPAPTVAPLLPDEAVPDASPVPQASARLGDGWDTTTDHLRSPGDEVPDGMPLASGVHGATVPGSPEAQEASPVPGIADLPGESTTPDSPNAAEATKARPGPSSLPLIALAGLMLAAGIGLGGLRLAARRLA
jgi:hypothetical protein